MLQILYKTTKNLHIKIAIDFTSYFRGLFIEEFLFAIKSTQIWTPIVFLLILKYATN